MVNSDADAVNIPPQVGRHSSAAVQRRLPGKPRPRAEALQEYERSNAELRKRIKPVFWPFYAPGPEEVFRWRIELDCECISEAHGYGDKRPPTEWTLIDPVSRKRMPTGQTICLHDGGPPAPYRDIVEWGDRREVSFPADPEEPPPGSWCEDPELWAKIRWGCPHTSAFWTVRLSCGHFTEVPTDLTWQPADGPKLVDPGRLREMIAEWEECSATEPGLMEDPERAHDRRMLQAGWPMPQPEETCYTCTQARNVIAYERVGWLVPRKPTPAQVPSAPQRADLEQRLRRVEAQAERLRAQLADLK